jgi:hypothetical protein
VKLRRLKADRQASWQQDGEQGEGLFHGRPVFSVPCVEYIMRGAVAGCYQGVTTGPLTPATVNIRSTVAFPSEAFSSTAGTVSYPSQPLEPCFPRFPLSLAMTRSSHARQAARGWPGEAGLARCRGE